MKRYTILLFAITITNSACQKFLDAKPAESLAVPSTVSELQALLDNYAVMSNNYPSTGEPQTDNYYVLPASYPAMSEENRNIYTWNKEDRPITSWKYAPIYQANVVLDEIVKIERTSSNASAYDNVQGSALFFRATYYYGIAQLYSPPYNKSTSNEKYGIPLRVNSDYNILSERSSIQGTYDQIISDLKRSVELLPITPTIKTRPSKPAAFGSLARVYLAMGEYQQAEAFADSCLKYYSTLLEYYKLTATLNAPFAQFNNEVIFHIRSANDPILNPSIARIDSNLYKSYDANDVRRTIFFKTAANNTFTFKGDYDAKGSSAVVFGGIVTDEQYLIRAECRARRGDLIAAMQDLNTLLVSRWNTGTYVNLTASNKEAALNIILRERRKELIGRGTRWTDLRRLMNDPIGATTPQRKVGTDLIQLPPNSPRYTLQIPRTVIQRSGIAQNP